MSVEGKTITRDDLARYEMEAKKLRNEQLAVLSSQLFRLPQTGLSRLFNRHLQARNLKTTTRT